MLKYCSIGLFFIGLMVSCCATGGFKLSADFLERLKKEDPLLHAVVDPVIVPSKPILEDFEGTIEKVDGKAKAVVLCGCAYDSISMGTEGSDDPSITFKREKRTESFGEDILSVEINGVLLPARTYLHFALQQWLNAPADEIRRGVVKILIEYGSSLSIPDHTGKSLLQQIEAHPALANDERVKMLGDIKEFARNSHVLKQIKHDDPILFEILAPFKESIEVFKEAVLKQKEDVCRASLCSGTFSSQTPRSEIVRESSYRKGESVFTQSRYKITIDGKTSPSRTYIDFALEELNKNPSDRVLQEMVEILIVEGAPLDIPNHEGVTPVDLLRTLPHISDSSKKAIFSAIATNQKGMYGMDGLIKKVGYLSSLCGLGWLTFASYQEFKKRTKEEEKKDAEVRKRSSVILKEVLRERLFAWGICSGIFAVTALS